MDTSTCVDLQPIMRQMAEGGPAAVVPDTSATDGMLYPHPSQKLIEMARSFWVTQMIYVAAKLGIADLMAAGTKSTAEMAIATGTHAASLYRLLRGLASLGVFAEEQQGSFRLTPLAESLQSGVPGSIRDWVVFLGDPQVWQPWGQLLHSVKTGEDAFPYVFGMNAWEYRAQDPAASAVFQAAMSANTTRQTAEILAGYDFSGIGTLVDIGGGQGVLLAAILQANPGMRGVLFDAPHVVGVAKGFLDEAGVADRCETVSGDFFAAVPSGGDAYLMKFIIHDWDDDRSAAILRNCRRAMGDAGRLLVVDRVIRPGNTPDSAKLADMNMLVQTVGGRERTPQEFCHLLAASGFALAAIYQTAGELCVVEGLPADQ